MVTNTGNVTITAPIVVSDNLIASVSCPALPTGGLAPDASISCTADYVVTQSDLDAGSVTNLATATDGTITTPIASETIPADAAPGLSIAKTSPDTSFASLGQTLTYSYALTNEGNITLTGDVSVTDDKIGSFVCFSGNLAPDQTESCTADYVVTQADLDAGSVTNAAFATHPSANSDPVELTLPADQAPALSLAKSTSTTGFAVIGDVLEYSYLVTNTGNVTITDPVTVSDDRITNVVCPALLTGGLAPNTSISCTGTDVVTQSDLDAGSVTNVATASDGTVTSPESRITVDGTQNPGLEMVKTATVVNFEAPGDITSYEYAVSYTHLTLPTTPYV